MFRKPFSLSLLIAGLILNLWLTTKVVAETQEQKDAKKAAEAQKQLERQATQTAKQTAEAEKKLEEQAARVAKKAAEKEAKFQKERERAKKEITVKEDKANGITYRDCKIRWVIRQDILGLHGVNGDVGLQFQVKTEQFQFKNDKTKIRIAPANVTMVLTYFSDVSQGPPHQNDHDGIITVDGRPITITQAYGYHTDVPSGINDANFRLEVIDFPLSYDDFSAIATGAEVKGNMGDVDFEVKDFDQIVFREMMDETTPRTVTLQAEEKIAATK